LERKGELKVGEFGNVHTELNAGAFALWVPADVEDEPGFVQFLDFENNNETK
jgi:hypothetical protein